MNRKNTATQNQGTNQGGQGGNGLIAQFQYQEEEKSSASPNTQV